MEKKMSNISKFKLLRCQDLLLFMVALVESNILSL